MIKQNLKIRKKNVIQSNAGSNLSSVTGYSFPNKPEHINMTVFLTGSAVICGLSLLPQQEFQSVLDVSEAAGPTSHSQQSDDRSSGKGMFAAGW